MRNYSKILLFIILLMLLVVGIITFLPSTYFSPVNTEIIETTKERQNIVFQPPPPPLIITTPAPLLTTFATSKEVTTATSETSISSTTSITSLISSLTTNKIVTNKPETKISSTIKIIPIETTTAIPVQTTEFIPRYGFTEDDIYLMTVVLCGSKNTAGDGEYDIDYGNQDRNDQISLVLGVIMNRVRSDLYPDTVSEVIWQRGQFVVMKRWSKNALPEVSDISLEIVRQWCEAYDNYDPSAQTIPEDHLGFYGDGYENHSYPLD